jgi:DNA-directed RNA polymerase specialized sigma24 family protein
VERVVSPRFPATAVPGAAQVAALTTAEREVLTEAFDRLGEDDRLVLASRYLFGLGRADAAKALSLTEALVDEHLHLALARLRTRMATA